MGGNLAHFFVLFPHKRSGAEPNTPRGRGCMLAARRTRSGRRSTGCPTKPRCLLASPMPPPACGPFVTVSPPADATDFLWEAHSLNRNHRAGHRRRASRGLRLPLEPPRRLRPAMAARCTGPTLREAPTIINALTAEDGPDRRAIDLLLLLHWQFGGGSRRLGPRPTMPAAAAARTMSGVSRLCRR